MSASSICDYDGERGKCPRPALFRGQYIHPKGKNFARCHDHLGHLSPSEKLIGGRWRAFNQE